MGFPLWTFHRSVSSLCFRIPLVWRAVRFIYLKFSPNQRPRSIRGFWFHLHSWIRVSEQANYCLKIVLDSPAVPLEEILHLDWTNLSSRLVSPIGSWTSEFCPLSRRVGLRLASHKIELPNSTNPLPSYDLTPTRSLEPDILVSHKRYWWFLHPWHSSSRGQSQ